MDSYGFLEWNLQFYQNNKSEGFFFKFNHTKAQFNHTKFNHTKAQLRVLSNFPMGSNSGVVGNEGFHLASSEMSFPHICKDLSSRWQNIGCMILRQPTWAEPRGWNQEPELRASRSRVSGHKTFRDVTSPDSLICLVGIQMPSVFVPVAGAVLGRRLRTCWSGPWTCGASRLIAGVETHRSHWMMPCFKCGVRNSSVSSQPAQLLLLLFSSSYSKAVLFQSSAGRLPNL